MTKNAATRLVEHEVAQRLVLIDPTRLLPQRRTGRWLDTTNNDIADLAFGVTTDNLDRAVEVESRVVLHGCSVAHTGGVVSVDGRFEAGDVIDIADTSGEVFARGIAAASSAAAGQAIGRHTRDLPDGIDEVVHRDDLVVLEPVTPIGERAGGPRR